MRTLFLMLILACTLQVVSCQKKSDSKPSPAILVISGESLTATGMLERQGYTTYMYGTHILKADAGKWFVLESTTLNLDPFVGNRVTITAINTHYHAEIGPEMYNVSAITAIH